MLITVKPKYEDLWFKKLMMEDEETMAYNHDYGGTIPFPIDKWQAWYDLWINNNERYYRYLSADNTLVGEIAYYYKDDKYFANVVILAKYRNKGYGKEALKMLCSICKENGIATLYDEIAIDNKAINLFLKEDFKEEYRTNKTIMLYKKL